MVEADEGLWTPADLARFLGYAESTIVRMASGEPEKLPPRVRTISKPRWVPVVCRQWALENSGQEATPPSPKVRVGRPRRVQAA